MILSFNWKLMDDLMNELDFGDDDDVGDDFEEQFKLSQDKLMHPDKDNMDVDEDEDEEDA